MDRKYFNSYEEAERWARDNFDKFDNDYIKYEYEAMAKGGKVDPHPDYPDFVSMQYAKGGLPDDGKLPNGKYEYVKGDEGMFQGNKVRVVKYSTSYGGIYEYNIIDENGKIKTHGAAKADRFEKQFRYFPKMAKGGQMAKNPAKFKDKVKAISKSLEGKKVPKRVRKDYGATYNKKESMDAAKRIAGSMAKKERKRYEI